MITRARLLFVPALMILVLGGVLHAEEEFLPTPYTAEEIREAWFDGFWVDTRTKSTAGVEVRRTRVVKHSDTTVTIVDQKLGDDGKPTGEPTEFEATWSELRNHALFPTARAERERIELKTALGRLEGWLYTVRGDEPGTSREFFFADGLAGAPVRHRTLVYGKERVRSEQVARAKRP